MLAGEQSDVRRALELLGQILVGAASPQNTADAFLAKHFGTPAVELVKETRNLSAVEHTTVGLVLGDLIAEYGPILGPDQWDDPPRWGSVDVGDETLSPPADMTLFFAPGRFCPSPIAVRIVDRTTCGGSSELMVFVRPEDRAYANSTLRAISDRARGERNLFRGRVLNVSCVNGMTVELRESPKDDRSNVIVSQEIWDEIDIGIASVTSQRDTMKRLGLGVRRGILLVGPPGVGKSAISKVVARELVGEFTVMFVDSHAGARVLSDVYKEANRFGPAVVILEDLDLYLENRRSSSGQRTTLAEFLSAMDAHVDSPILTIASTNEVTTLDGAAIRSARFDSIIEIGYPTRVVLAEIMDTYLADIPGGGSIDAARVCNDLPQNSTGADVREIVRRTVLANDGTVSTEALRVTVSGGRFKPELPVGTYL
ncbi:ATP-binding protein [Mycobacterium sp. CBMA271]|nr:cell division protein [Mycobacteroides sp. CBMA 326]MUM24674.1 ATP-binding protein [Mycobacteroides sp. CBMA 271]